MAMRVLVPSPNQTKEIVNQVVGLTLQCESFKFNVMRSSLALQWHKQEAVLRIRIQDPGSAAFYSLDQVSGSWMIFFRTYTLNSTKNLIPYRNTKKMKIKFVMKIY
jgi:hypothetical protein